MAIPNLRSSFSLSEITSPVIDKTIEHHQTWFYRRQAQLDMEEVTTVDPKKKQMMRLPCCFSDFLRDLTPKVNSKDTWAVANSMLYAKCEFIQGT